MLLLGFTASILSFVSVLQTTIYQLQTRQLPVSSWRVFLRSVRDEFVIFLSIWPFEALPYRSVYPEESAVWASIPVALLFPVPSFWDSARVRNAWLYYCE